MVETTRGCGRSRACLREQWRHHVEAQSASGLSGVAYCRRHGLHAKSFYRWRRVFGAGAATRVDGVSPGVEAARPAFAEVRVGEAADVAQRRLTDGCARVEVVAQSGRAIRVWPGFDGETLARTVAVLEGLYTPGRREC